MAYFGLYALQHRGQESTGIASYDGKHIRLHAGMGLVPDAVRGADTGLEAVAETGCGSGFMGAYGMQGTGVGSGGRGWIRICSPEDTTFCDGET